MDVYVAVTVGLALMGGVMLLGFHILRDLRHMRETEAYFREQRRLMRRLEGLQFDRDHFFDQVDQYRSAFDGR